MFKNLTNFIKSRFCKGCPDPNAKIFSSSTEVTAKSAYMQSKYGKTTSQKDLLKNFFEQVHNTIQTRCQRGYYYYMVEIDEDITEFTPQIVEHFRDKLGYKTAIINNNTRIIEYPKHCGTMLQPNGTFIILMWNTAHISEDVFVQPEDEADTSSDAINEIPDGVTL